MKKKILDALKAKFTGVSDKVLDRIAEKGAKTVTTEEEVTTFVNGVTFQQVLDSYGDSRATEASLKAVQNYEKKHGLKDGKAVEQEPDEEEPDDEDEEEDVEPDTKPKTKKGRKDGTPKWAKAQMEQLKALVEQNKQLTERLNNMDAERTTKSRKQQLDKVLAQLPENLRKGYNRMSYDKLSDEDFEKLVGEVTTEVGELATATKQKGLVFGSPNAHNGGQQDAGKATAEEAKAVVDKMRL